MKAVIGDTSGDSLNLSLSSSDVIAASGLSFSIQLKIGPEVYTLKKARAIDMNHEEMKCSNTLISESGKGFNFGDILKKNNFKLVINAKVRRANIKIEVFQFPSPFQPTVDCHTNF